MSGINVHPVTATAVLFCGRCRAPALSAPGSDTTMWPLGGDAA